jgi:hypothetical protein
MQGATPPPPNGAQMPPTEPQPAAPLNINPITNPTHPAHVMASKHLGAALGHFLAGNHEDAKAHLHEFIEHLAAPHVATKTAMPQPESKPTKKPAKKKRKK